MSIERLTKRTQDGIAYLAKVKDSEQAVEGSKNTLECLFESWQRLADYEDAEENGTLVLLPIKIGTPVYHIKMIRSGYSAGRITPDYPSGHFHDYEVVQHAFSFNDIGRLGKCVYSSYEEAERAMKLLP